MNEISSNVDILASLRADRAGACSGFVRLFSMKDTNNLFLRRLFCETICTFNYKRFEMYRFNPNL